MALSLIGAIAFEVVMLIWGWLVGPASDPVREFAEVRGAIKGAIAGGLVLVVVTGIALLANLAFGPVPVLSGVARGLLLALGVMGGSAMILSVIL